MVTSSATVASSTFKPHLFRNDLQKWSMNMMMITKYARNLQIQRRPTSFPFLHLPNTFLLHPQLAPIRYRHFLSHTPLLVLHRIRSPSFLSPMSSLASSTDSSAIPAKTNVRVVVKGRVQGVFYRNWTVENAVELGLKGWVRNRRDGSVEALFSGSPDKVQEMEQRCRRGPAASMVTGLLVFPSVDHPGTVFERWPTA